jgi:RHS repeat-associated protein
MNRQSLQTAVLISLVTAIGLFNPLNARADATAGGLLTFNNLSITPDAGSFQTVTNWQGTAYAQATLTEQYNSGTAPAANALGDYSFSQGTASATTPLNGLGSANASILGQTLASDQATGQGSLVSWFMITGGSGPVSALFSAAINGSLSVLTDVNGESANAETVFSLEVDGGSVLFDDRYFSIGPSDGNSQNFSTVLNNTMTLQYNTVYELYVQADAEVSVSNIPEPGATSLMGAGMILLWLGWRRGNRRFTAGRTTAVGLVVGAALLSFGNLAQAMYLGSDPPDSTGPNVRQFGGTIQMSLTEGNLREDYPVVTLQSGSGPTLQFSLTYNSYNADGSRAQVDSGVGLGWTHSYNLFLFQQRGSFFRMGPDGRITQYHLGHGGTYTTDSGYFETLTPQSDGSFIITNKYQSWWRFASIPNTPFLVGGPVYRLTQMGDRNGNVTTLTYNPGSGLLIQITDPYGRSLNLGYSSQHLTTITDPLGRTTQIQYDSRFRTPIRITDPAGKVVRYSYNSLYQMNRKIDRDGRTYLYLFKNQRPWAVVDGGGQTWFSLSNSNDWAVDRYNLALTLRRIYIPSTTTNTDGNGNVWRYQYDTNGYITRTTAPDSSTTSYAYDSSTRLISSVTNANGAVTRYQYDSLGNRTNTTDALGHVTTYTYDPVFNQVTSQTDPRGLVTRYQYDSRGNRTNEIDALGHTASYAYDSRGNLTSITDRNGNSTTYAYDAVGNRTNQTDALGHTTTYTYDAIGNQLSTTDPLGRVTTYGYDALDRMTAVTNALGGVATYTYDPAGNRLSTTDPLGSTMTYQYDTRSRLVQTTDAVGGVTTYTYDPDNNRIAQTNQLGQPTIYTYDSRNRIIATTDALGGVTTTAYDAVGNVTNSTDANGHTTSYQYDAINRQIETVDALGGVTTTIYDADSDVTVTVDPLGHTTTYQYDALNRQVSRTNGVGGVTVTTYDADGNQLSVTDPVGHTTTYGYDALNRQTSVTNAAGDVTTTTYGAVGNVVMRTVPNGNITSYAYDALNRAISAYDTVGPVKTNSYDADGNMISTIDPLGHTTSYQYDAMNRQIQTTDALGRTTTYSYDPVGNLTTNVDRNGNVTVYTYDALNRHSGTADALGYTTTYAYDAVGNVTNLTDANGHITTYTYDGLNRRITETYPEVSPNTVTYLYDGAGNVINRADQNGQVTTYAYDGLYDLTNRSYLPSGSSDNFTYDVSGRLLSAERNGWVDTFAYDGANRLVDTAQNGRTLTYTYDIQDRVQTNTYPSGRTLNYTYDARNRLTTLNDGTPNPPITTYTYDAANRVITRDYRNGTTTTYTYDPDNRVSSLEHSNAVGRVVGFGYAYDNEGNTLYEEKRHTPGDSEAYAYDALNRLVTYDVGTLSGLVIPSPVLEKTWSLDPVGNWNSVVSNLVTETRTYGPANELQTVNAQTYFYDANGNLRQDSAYVYAYDEENRLTQVQRLSDSAIVGQYFYDALGRRIIQIASPTNTLTTTNIYFYDRSRLVEEEDAGGATRAIYTYGYDRDEVLTMDRPGQTYYYHQNALWTPLALTDAGGNPVERYTYDVYGDVTVLDGSYNPIAPNPWGTPHSAVTNGWLYQGRQQDEESGLHHFRQRYYDSDKGRYLQRSPLDAADGVNRYEFAGSNPTRDLTPEEQAKWAREKTLQIRSAQTRIQHLLLRAREKRDVIMVICIEDKLSRISVLARQAQEILVDLDHAVARGDKSAAVHHYQLIVLLHKRMLDLVRDADACVGSEFPAGDAGVLPVEIAPEEQIPSKNILPPEPTPSKPVGSNEPDEITPGTIPSVQRDASMASPGVCGCATGTLPSGELRPCIVPNGASVPDTPLLSPVQPAAQEPSVDPLAFGATGGGESFAAGAPGVLGE